MFNEPLLNKNIYKMIDMAEEAGIPDGAEHQCNTFDPKNGGGSAEQSLVLDDGLD